MWVCLFACPSLAPPRHRFDKHNNISFIILGKYISTFFAKGPHATPKPHQHFNAFLMCVWLAGQRLFEGFVSELVIFPPCPSNLEDFVSLLLFTRVWNKFYAKEDDSSRHFIRKLALNHNSHFVYFLYRLLRPDYTHILAGRCEL